MAWAWDPLGAVGVVVGLFGCAMGALVWSAPAARAQNRLLAAYLVLQGIYFLGYNGLRLFMTDPRDAYAMLVAGWLPNPLANGVFVVFLSTLDTPLTSWMKRYGLAWVVASPLFFVALDSVARPELWIAGVEPLAGSPGWGAVGTPLRAAFLLGLVAFALGYSVPAIHAARRARAPLARRQGAIFAMAVTVNAFGWGGFLVWYTLVGSGTLTPPVVATNFLWQAANLLVLIVGLAYGILKAQLFDIDLKIKWTIRKGTVAAAFVGVFFVVSEGAQTLLSERLGPFAGLLAAGGLVFALAPLQRLGDGVAERAMPRVQDNEGYRLVRKVEVYRAAVESALVEGGDISPKERGMLATLAEQLGIGPKEMHDIEREARHAIAGVA